MVELYFPPSPPLLCNYGDLLKCIAEKVPYCLDFSCNRKIIISWRLLATALANDSKVGRYELKKYVLVKSAPHEHTVLMEGNEISISIWYANKSANSFVTIEQLEELERTADDKAALLIATPFFAEAVPLHKEQCLFWLGAIKNTPKENWQFHLNLLAEGKLVYRHYKFCMPSDLKTTALLQPAQIPSFSTILWPKL